MDDAWRFAKHDDEEAIVSAESVGYDLFHVLHRLQDFSAATRKDQRVDDFEDEEKKHGADDQDDGVTIMPTKRDEDEDQRQQINAEDDDYGSPGRKVSNTLHPSSDNSAETELQEFLDTLPAFELQELIRQVSFSKL